MSQERLTELQVVIDNLDEAMLGLLAQRFAASREIGALKFAAGTPPYDPTRIASQVGQFGQKAASYGLEPALALQLMSAIIAQVLVERLNQFSAR